MERNDRENELQRKADEFLKIFKKGEEFTHELLVENERLRYKIIKIEEENKALQKSGNIHQIQQLQEINQDLEKEKEDLFDRFRESEKESMAFVDQYVEVEEENNNLANLYVASYQLHSTLDFDEVLRLIIEIIINMIGSDKFAVFLCDEDSNNLSIVASEGIHEEKTKRIKVGEGKIGEVAKTGDSFFEPDIKNFKPKSEMDPIICIPLIINDHLIGVIAVFSLFEQKKDNLSKGDYELFSMLGGHAATAIFSAKLYSKSERKVSTMQGFINLLSKNA